MDRRNGRATRRATVAAVSAVACLVAPACGDPSDEAAPPTTERTESTTSTPATTSTTTTVPDLPPCDPAAGFRQVAADWLPEALPEGWELVHASTQVYRREAQPAGPEHWSFFLVERLDGDRLGLKLGVGAAVEEGDHHLQLAAEEPVLQTTRGRPATVGRWVSRGDPVGTRMARWEEGGLHWSASTAPDALTNEELVAVLDRLEIGRDRVSDPTGRLTLLGRSRSTPPPSEDRYTRVHLRRTGAPVNERVQIDVDAPVEGTTGITHTTGDRVIEDDRGIAVSGGRISSARQPSGLGLHLEAIDMSGKGAAPTLSAEDVAALLLTPWSRVADDDPRRRTVALADPDHSAEQLDFCRE
jgi:hypothetical protein